ncbi:alpha-L-fucosidase [Pedobacter sp. MC2016-05]|uniref:alpha-L-fucosidase n=1 Tax=Pedobacter sp. MC2016-05 TaxID=2994474 RepID=UPI0022468863|nr:alpha-L-fucosidase [Pedobacter sp. MC2016-05]MCX2477002.1 alpha-L-fucosidase [Pedobacter sp. MC2016-05]
MIKKIFICLSFIFLCNVTSAQKALDIQNAKERDQRMAWWREARFGMFIHFGIYAQFGGEYKGHFQKAKNGEWLFNRMKVPVAEYKAMAQKFNPKNYDAEKWVKTAKEAGMKYIVVTAKHHDGFALFDTKVSDWSITKASPYGKDMLKPLAEACRKYGVKLCFYYSQAQDWGNAGGATALRPMRQGWPNPDSTRIDAYAKANSGSWDPIQTAKPYAEYFRKVALPQVKELLTNYGDIAVIWWDTPMYRETPETREMYELVKNLAPNIIQNDRLGVPGVSGDFKTPEQKIPNWEELDGQDWETCMTMNDTWGYRKDDKNWKSAQDLVRKLIDITSKGGNFLLNVGPQPDGTFPPESVERLATVGNWMKKYGAAVYGSHANPIEAQKWGRITAKDEKKATTLYLSVFDWPADGALKLAGIPHKALSATLVGGKSKLKLTQSDDGSLEITGLPLAAPDDIASVIEVKLKGFAKKKSFGLQRKMNSGSID